jgi:hypothetical protein
MLARALVFTIVFTLAWLGIKHFIATYGVLIPAVAVATLAIYFFGRFVGPKLPVYLGGDPPALPAVEPNPEWDLYIAMNGGSLEQVMHCLERGANPHKTFAPDRTPSTTSARNCHEFAQQTDRLQHFVSVFDGHGG